MNQGYTDYDPMTAYLLSGQARPPEPTHYETADPARLAADTLSLPNKAAWNVILTALRAAGVPALKAGDVRKEVWKIRKALRRCPTERT